MSADKLAEAADALRHWYFDHAEGTPPELMKALAGALAAYQAERAALDATGAGVRGLAGSVTGSSIPPATARSGGDLVSKEDVLEAVRHSRNEAELVQAISALPAAPLVSVVDFDKANSAAALYGPGCLDKTESETLASAILAAGGVGSVSVEDLDAVASALNFVLSHPNAPLPNDGRLSGNAVGHALGRVLAAVGEK